MKNKRRGNGKGGVNYNKDRGKYIINYTLGRDPKTGSIIRKTKSYETKEEAELALQKVLYERDHGIMKNESNITFGEWIDYWLEEVRSNKLSGTTLDNYRSNIRNHIIPGIGHIKLKDLRPKHLQVFYNHLYENGRRDGNGGLSPQTVQRIHVMIGSALKHALRNELVITNVATVVERRKGKKFRTKPYTIDELFELLRVTKGDRFYPAYVISSMTGMRRGEVLALKWQDIDFEEKTIKVERSLSIYRENKDVDTLKLELKPPKTEQSERTIPIDDFVVKTLKDHKKKQAEISMKIGRDGYNPEMLIFCDEQGEYVNPNTYSNDFRSTLKENGLRHVRLHDLRHTYATLLLKYGVGHEKIRDLLGHSTIVTTLDIYAHVDIDDLKVATSLLSKAMSDKRSNK